MTNKLIEAADRLRDLVQEQFENGCEICHGDCGSANPTVARCPVRRRHTALTAYRSARESAGEVNADGLESAARLSVMYLESGFINCARCGEEVETKGTDAEYCLKEAITKHQSSKGLKLSEKETESDWVEDACNIFDNDARALGWERHIYSDKLRKLWGEKRSPEVKPLVFNRVGAEWHCYSNIGLYLVSPMGGGGYGVWFPVSDPEGEPDLIEDGDVPALAAAQADYETRIRSAIAE